MEFFKDRREAILKDGIIRKVLVDKLRNEFEIAERLGVDKALVNFCTAKVLNDQRLGNRKAKGSNVFDLYPNEWTEGFSKSGGYLTIYYDNLKSKVFRWLSAIGSITAIGISWVALMDSNKALDIAKSDYEADRTLILKAHDNFYSYDEFTLESINDVAKPQESIVFFPTFFKVQPFQLVELAI